jgi:DNA-binding phage protein
LSISPVTGSAGTQAAQGPQRHHHHHLPKGVVDAAATALDMSSDDVKTALKSGSTLADLAKGKGISSDDLTKAIATALKANKPANAPDLSDDQLTEMASNIVAGKRPNQPPPGRPPAPSLGTITDGSKNAAVSDFAKLAKDLGVSSEDLLRQLSSGDSSSLSGLVTAYGKSADKSKGLLADFSA